MRWAPWVPSEVRYDYANYCTLIDRAGTSDHRVTATVVVCAGCQNRAAEVVAFEGALVLLTRLQLPDNAALMDATKDGPKVPHDLFWSGFGLVLGIAPPWPLNVEREETLRSHGLPAATLATCPSCGPLTFDLAALETAARRHRKRFPASVIQR